MRRIPFLFFSTPSFQPAPHEARENAPQLNKISSADEIKMNCGRNNFRLQTIFSTYLMYHE